MDLLPAEILAVILSCLNGIDLKCLRRTSKLFEHSVTALLFKNVTIWLSPQGLDTLRRHSKIERLATRVHALRIELRLYPVSVQSETHWLSKRSSDEAKRVFRHVVKAQSEWELSTSALQSLADSLGRLTNLTTIDISTDEYCFRNNDDSITPHRFRYADRYADLVFVQMRHLMLASSLIEGGLNIEKLIIDISDVQGYWNVNEDASDTTSREAAVHPAFEPSQRLLDNLRHLYLNGYTRAPMSKQSLFNFLSAMRLLEVVDIRQPDEGYGNWPHDHILSILKEVTWPHLRSVTLPSVEAHKDQVLNFLQRHKLTLRRLHLRDLYILDTTLNSLLREIREGFDIEVFMLDGVIGAEPKPGLSRRWRIGRDDDGTWYQNDKQSNLRLCEAIDAFVTRKSLRYPGSLLKNIVEHELEKGEEPEDSDFEDIEDAQSLEFIGMNDASPYRTC